MAYESLSLSELIPASGEQIYSAWLNSVEHSQFTGDKAEIEPVVGGKHSSFDGYAQGMIVDLQPGRRIVQTWRTSDFPDGSPDSRLELTLEVTVGGTMLTLLHTDIPDGQSDNYRDGWMKHYLDPLKRFFAERTVPDGAPDSETGQDNHRENGVPDAKAPATKVRARAKSPAAPPAAPATPAATTKAPPARPPKAKVKAKAKAKAAPKAKPAVKAKAAGKPKAKTKAKAKAKVQVKAKTKAKTKLKAAVRTKAAAKKKPAAKAKAKAKPTARKAGRAKAKRGR